MGTKGAAESSWKGRGLQPALARLPALLLRRTCRLQMVKNERVAPGMEAEVTCKAGCSVSNTCVQFREELYH